MKVALLTDTINEHSGARAAIKLGEALGQIPGTEVVFFGSDFLMDEETKARLRQKFRVHVFPKPLIFSFTLLKKIRTENVDVILAHSSLRILISAYFSGIPVLRTDYGTQFPSLNGDFGSWKIGTFSQALNLLADVYVYLRDFAKFFFCRRTVAISRSNAEKIYGLYRRRVPFVYLGCDDFLPGQKKVTNDAPFPPLSILSVSRFVPYKGFHILAAIFKSLKNKYPRVHLTLVGGQGKPNYLNFLKKAVGDEENVSLVFNPNDETLLALYKSSDIYASCTRWEGFGLPFLEASSFGLPVVGFSFFGPANEVVQDGKTGFLAAGTEEFKEKLGKLLEDAGLRERMGQAGVLFSKEFTWNKCAGEYAKIIKEIL